MEGETPVKVVGFEVNPAKEEAHDHSDESAITSELKGASAALDAGHHHHQQQQHHHHHLEQHDHHHLDASLGSVQDKAEEDNGKPESTNYAGVPGDLTVNTPLTRIMPLTDKMTMSPKKLQGTAEKMPDSGFLHEDEQEMVVGMQQMQMASSDADGPSASASASASAASESAVSSGMNTSFTSVAANAGSELDMEGVKGNAADLGSAGGDTDTAGVGGMTVTATAPVMVPVLSEEPSTTTSNNNNNNNNNASMGDGSLPKDGGINLGASSTNNNTNKEENAGAAGDKEKEKDNKDKDKGFKKKPKLSKAERRELQEKQRAAKAALKGEATSSGPKSKQDKGPPKPQSQYDNEKKVQKQKRKSIVPRTATEKSVELFSHLPQFDKQPLEESFQKIIVSGLHPEVVKLGKSYSTNSISGANARCVAMLSTFKLVIQEYTTPPGKTLARDLTSHLNMIIQFLIDCRPLGVSMGNAIRFLKTKMGSIDPNTPEIEAKRFLIDTIDRFIQDKILDAASIIAETASTKIRDGNTILTYAFSHSVYQTFKCAHRRGIKFRVVVADCRPHFEGRKLMSRLVKLGIDCTYLHIASLSYIMPQVTTVFLGAASALANGTVISRVGTAVVAMVASEFGIPVAVCCETYKFHERVQLDSITFNELGDPEALVDVRNRPEVQGLQEWDSMPSLRLLNLMYDALTEKYITMIITEVGMIPASSVPVILREYSYQGDQY